MQEFRAQRLRLRDFAVEKGIPISTFRRWFKEWEMWQRDARLALLPEKPLAWLPPKNLSGYKEATPIRDGLLTLMVDLADNLGPHTERAQSDLLCCDGLVISGRLIGAQEYFDGMRETVLEGAGELMEKYKRAAAEALEKLLPNTERLPERREEWDDFYEPDDRRDAPDYIHLAEATIQRPGSGEKQVTFWRGRLSAVSSFWTE